MFRALQTLSILAPTYTNYWVRGFQKGKTWSCISGAIRVVVSQSLNDIVYYVEEEFSVTSNLDIS